MNDIDLTIKSLMAQELDLSNDQYNENVIAALVGNPLNNEPEGIEINGSKSSNVFLDVADLDYKSMYPFIKIKNNIDRVVQYFRVIIEKRVSDMENRRDQPLYWRGGEFVEDYSTKNFLTFCRKWFGLKSITHYIKEFKKESEGNNLSGLVVRREILENKYTLIIKDEFKTN